MYEANEKHLKKSYLMLAFAETYGLGCFLNMTLKK